MYQAPITGADLKTQLRAITDHSRPPDDAEILSALNFGLGEAIRSISAVRPQFFASWVDNFTIPANTKEIDLSGIEPPIWRPHRLLCDAVGGLRGVRFRYKALNDLEFEDNELSQSGSFTTLFYDLLTGQIPVFTDLVVANALNSQTRFYMANPSRFANNQQIYVESFGAPGSVDGAAVFASYYGTVTAVGGLFIDVQPPAGGVPVAGLVVHAYRSRVMVLANTLGLQATGRLYYQARPPRLRALTDVVAPMLAEYRDLVVYYAASQFLAATNDSEANAWFQKAQQLRSEMMQDIEPLSGQGSEGLGSDLWALD